jgi:hypothetical protein
MQAMERNPAFAVAPYISYGTFEKFLGDISRNGLPPVIDRDVLQTFNGSLKSQLLSALRFLNLITEKNQPTRSLEMLLQAAGQQERQSVFLDILTQSYGPLMGLPLESVTRLYLLKEFARLYNSREDTTRKQLSFFMNAAQDAGVEMSKRLDHRRRVASTGRLGTVRQKSSSAASLPAHRLERQGTHHPTAMKTVKLHRGGTVTLSVDVNPLELEGSDREFVFKLIDAVNGYSTVAQE